LELKNNFSSVILLKVRKIFEFGKEKVLIKKYFSPTRITYWLKGRKH